MSDEEFCVVTCNECGIAFKFSTKIEELWRKSSKTFFCPNGHSLHWPKQKESEEQQEIKKLKAEINELRTKLVAAEKQAEAEKKRANDLQLELEIYKPATIKE